MTNARHTLSRFAFSRSPFRQVLTGLLLSVFLTAGGSARAQVVGHVLWQIGQEDQDDKEFALAPDQWSRYGEDGFYLVGQSKAKSDWSYVQPGPEDDWAGSRPHTATVEFQMIHAEPQGTARLTLALVDSHSSSPPQLKITVNGQSWTRDTLRGAGDESINGQANHGRYSAVTVEFPAGLLRAGLNTVQITTLTGSWMLYDAVTLTAPAEDTLGAAPAVFTIKSAEWLHTILKRQGNTLAQVLRLKTYNSGPRREVALHVSGEAAHPLTIPTGPNTQEVPFPESQAAAPSQVQLFAQGQPLGEALTTDRKPCRRYTIYCLEHSHMDIGYAYLQEKALALHQQYLETGLTLNAKEAGLPSDGQFRWNIESLVEVDDWLKKATPAQVSTFRLAVKTGNLGISALYGNELTGLCRPEELVALLGCAERLRRQYKIPIDSAMISDVPGYTWGLVPMLAQSGVQYISWGPNGSDHIGAAAGFNNKAFYWVSPSGKEKVLVWQGPNGYYRDFNATEPSLMQFLNSFERQNPRYPYDMIYSRHTQADNGPADLDLAPFVREWNSRYAFPHLVMATTSRLFHDFEARYGSRLPRVHGDYTGYWEDGAASTARETAINRQAAETLAQDQILYSMLAPAQYPSDRFDTAWKNAVLYDEHTWGADRSWSEPESDFTRQQWEYKKQFALNARDQAQSLKRGALKAVAAPAASNTIAVFNTNSWPRTDLVVLPAGMSRAGSAVRDDHGRAVASQRLADGSLAFLASDVPALAARTFRILPGASHVRGSAAAANGLLRTKRLSLRIDSTTGAIVSWKAQGIAQDLVDSRNKISRGLNDYLYILGAKNDRVQYASGVKLTVVDSGPLVATIRITSPAPGCRSLSRLVQVVDGLDQVRITDTLDKLAVHQDEAVHFGFSFHVPKGKVRLDMPWSVVRPDRDQTVYANKNVYPVGRWADVSNDEFGVTCANLDTPMMQIGEITSPREGESHWLKSAKRGSTLYWNAMNNYWHTNYKAYQPGTAVFRYVLTAHWGNDQAAAQRFGISQSQPLLFTAVRAGQPSVRLPLTLSNKAVVVTACHPAGDGKGWLVRLFNGSDRVQRVRPGWRGAKHLHAWQTNLWGSGAKPVELPLALVPMEIVTLRLMP